MFVSKLKNASFRVTCATVALTGAVASKLVLSNETSQINSNRYGPMSIIFVAIINL